MRFRQAIARSVRHAEIQRRTDAVIFLNESISLNAENRVAVTSLLTKGFGQPEALGTWAQASRFSILFRLPYAETNNINMAVRIVVTPIAARNYSPDVDVRWEDEEWQNLKLQDDGPERLTLELPLPDAHVRGNAYRLDFRCNNARSPKQLGLGEDTRTLVWLFREVALVPVSGDSEGNLSPLDRSLLDHRKPTATLQAGASRGWFRRAFSRAAALPGMGFVRKPAHLAKSILHLSHATHAETLRLGEMQSASVERVLQDITRLSEKLDQNTIHLRDRADARMAELELRQKEVEQKILRAINSTSREQSAAFGARLDRTISALNANLKRSNDSTHQSLTALSIAVRSAIQSYERRIGELDLSMGRMIGKGLLQQSDRIDELERTVTSRISDSSARGVHQLIEASQVHFRKLLQLIEETQRGIDTALDLINEVSTATEEIKGSTTVVENIATLADQFGRRMDWLSEKHEGYTADIISRLAHASNVLQSEIKSDTELLSQKLDAHASVYLAAVDATTVGLSDKVDILGQQLFPRIESGFDRIDSQQLNSVQRIESELTQKTDELIAHASNLIQSEIKSDTELLSQKLDAHASAYLAAVDATTVGLSDKVDMLGQQLFPRIESGFDRIDSQQLNSAQRMESELTRRTDELIAHASNLIQSEIKSDTELLSQKLDAHAAAYLAAVDATTVGLSDKVDMLGQQLFPRIESGFDRIDSQQLNSAQRMESELTRRTNELKSQKVLPTNDGWIVRSNYGYISCPMSDPWVAAVLLETGELEPGTGKFISNFLHPGDTFIDVGANVGIHTMAAVRAIGSKGCILAIEASPDTAMHLRRTISLNGLGEIVKIEAAAAGSRNGNATLHLGTASGLNSLHVLPDSVGNITVPIRKLDSLAAHIKPARLWKIDVEGAELEVLDGAAKLLSTSVVPTIIAEFGASHLSRVGVSPKQWFDRFMKLGVRCFEINEVDGRLIEHADTSVLWNRPSVNLVFSDEDLSAHLAEAPGVKDEM